ncbi:MAG: MBL fold metallo-hydrolase, partial [Puniceicoccales bacterium]|nr:MBL fold metallo-hydrolase [Puniceicoccales bacterium]
AMKFHRSFNCTTMKFDMLGSGSTGNCGLIRTKNSIVLVDAGFSCKRTKEMLSAHNVCLEQVNAVFITHEHFDHIQGLRGLSKFKHISFFANRRTANAMERIYGFNISWKTFSTADKLTFNDLNIVSFSVPHDAVDPLGYVFSVTADGSTGGMQSIAWMTDLGYIPSHVLPYVSNVDLLIIESNYDNDLLTMDTKRPPFVKDRIRSRHGHLPNEAAINFIKNNKCNQWKKVILAHVSAECNNERSIRKLLDTAKELKFEVDIAHP